MRDVWRGVGAVHLADRAGFATVLARVPTTGRRGGRVLAALGRGGAPAAATAVVALEVAARVVAAVARAGHAAGAHVAVWWEAEGVAGVDDVEALKFWNLVLIVF